MHIDTLIAAHRTSWRPDSLLAQLNDETLRRLTTAGDVVQFAAGETLIVEGARDTTVYLLLSSSVKVTARQDRGAGEALLAMRFGGDVVGEMAAIDRRARSASVKACGRQPVVAVAIGHEEFQATLAQDPPAMLLLSASISDKLRSANRRRIDFSGCSPSVRLAKVLLELAETRGSTTAGVTVIGVDLTQIELGTLVGVSRPTAERGLRELRARQLVDTGGRRFIVRDLEALRRLAAGGDSGVAIK